MNEGGVSLEKIERPIPDEEATKVNESDETRTDEDNRFGRSVGRLLYGYKSTIGRLFNLPHFRGDLDLLFTQYKTQLPRSLHHSEAFYEILEAVVHYGKGEQVNQAFQFILDSMNSDNQRFKNFAASSIPIFFESKELQIFEAAAKKFKELIGNFGLDPKETVEAWRDSIEDSGNMRRVAENLLAIYELESTKPNSSICKVLNSEFGIYDFARYPPNLLVEQFEHMNDACCLTLS